MSDGKRSVVADIIDEARETVCHDREETHGSIRENFAQIAAFWSAYLGCDVTAKDVAVMMVLVKISRQSVGAEAKDHYVDMVGYSGIAGSLTSGDSE